MAETNTNERSIHIVASIVKDKLKRKNTRKSTITRWMSIISNIQEIYSYYIGNEIIHVKIEGDIKLKRNITK